MISCTYLVRSKAAMVDICLREGRHKEVLIGTNEATCLYRYLMPMNKANVASTSLTLVGWRLGQRNGMKRGAAARSRTRRPYLFWLQLALNHL